VAIRKFPRAAHEIASRLGDNYTSMEEMESKDLLRHAEIIDHRHGTARALAVVDFAALCVTQVGKHVATAKKHLGSGVLPTATPGAANQAAVEALCQVAQSPEPAAVASALAAIARLPDSKTYRRELLTEMQGTLRLAASAPGRPWADVAWDIRDRARRNGRALERRIVSRTLLVKGLEFDHAIVLNADELDIKDLYVAMTRASRTLTVLTSG
jgi:hypothetical protein